MLLIADGGHCGDAAALGAVVLHAERHVVGTENDFLLWTRKLDRGNPLTPLSFDLRRHLRSVFCHMIYVNRCTLIWVVVLALLSPPLETGYLSDVWLLAGRHFIPTHYLALFAIIGKTDKSGGDKSAWSSACSVCCIYKCHLKHHSCDQASSHIDITNVDQGFVGSYLLLWVLGLSIAPLLQTWKLPDWVWLWWRGFLIFP